MLRQLLRTSSCYRNLVQTRFVLFITNFSQKMSTSFERLPYDIKPINYNLEFIPNLNQYTFEGNAIIKLQVDVRTDKIVLNSKDIEISSAICNSAEAEIEVDTDNEKVVFFFENPLEEGEVDLYLKFNAKFAEDMQGFYISKFKSANNVDSDILCTQFESIYARRCFPCFDEPDRKATFDISIVVTGDLVALSNMPEISREIFMESGGLAPPPEGYDYVKVKFDTTPLMSTYLMAIVVGKFEFVSAKDEYGVEVRVYTPPGKTACGEFALNTAIKTLPYYASIFGCKFPLPKLDLIAIPDFACGAMENWGLVTYRERALLIDAKQSSLLTKQSVALTVTHELAHMWFGNLVTMEWWTHLWLKEGFATWVEFLAVDYCFPDYDIWTLFVTGDYACAMRLDELNTSHPIEVEVKIPSEIEEIFDAVSYKKGASVIRMLNAYLGNETECVHNLCNLTTNFRTGLQHYIDKHRYGNTVTEDLWRALKSISCQPINEIMSTWTKQMGFPVLSVRMLLSANPEILPSLAVKQRRFLADGSLEAVPTEWYIPLTVCKADENNFILARTLLPPSDMTKIDPTKMEHIVPLTSPAETGVRLNPSAIGFYRVHYEKSMMPHIIRAIKDGCVPETDRLSILNDQFALARAGIISLIDVLEFCRAFRGEEQYSVWVVLAHRLGQVRLLLEESTYPKEVNLDDEEKEDEDFDEEEEDDEAAAEREKLYFPKPTPELLGFNSFCTSLALPVYERIGFEPCENDSNNESLLRPLIITMLGHAEHPGVIAKARTAFNAHYETVTYESPKEMEPDAMDLVLEIDENTISTTTYPKIESTVVKPPDNFMSPDLRKAVYSICLRTGGEETFKQLLALHDKASMQDERVRLLSCLGSVENSVLIKRLFEMTFSDYVRKQDRFNTILGVTAHPYGRRALWHLVKKRIDTLPEELATTNMLAHVLKGSCSSFFSMEKHDEVKAFFDEHEMPCLRSIQQAIESIKINTSVLKRNGPEAKKFLTLKAKH